MRGSPASQWRSSSSSADRWTAAQPHGDDLQRLSHLGEPAWTRPRTAADEQRRRHVGPGDRWAVPALAPEDTDGWYDYQYASFAFAGRGARERVADVPLDPASANCCTVEFDLALPPNSTRYLLFFTEQHTTRAATLKGIQKFNRRTLTKPLLAGIPRKVRKRILNWKLEPIRSRRARSELT